MGRSLGVGPQPARLSAPPFGRCLVDDEVDGPAAEGLGKALEQLDVNASRPVPILEVRDCCLADAHALGKRLLAETGCLAEFPQTNAQWRHVGKGRRYTGCAQYA